MLKNFAHRLLSVSLVNVTTSNKFSNDSLISPNTKPMFKRSSCLKKNLYICIYTYIHIYIYLKILLIYFYFFRIFYLFTFRERGRERREGEKHQCVRDISCFSQGPQPVTRLSTQTCALTGN